MDGAMVAGFERSFLVDAIRVKLSQSQWRLEASLMMRAASLIDKRGYNKRKATFFPLFFTVILSGVRPDEGGANGVEGSLEVQKILRLRKNSAIAPFLLRSE
jgi:hypothetical protein